MRKTVTYIVGIGLTMLVCVVVPLAACKIFAASQPNEIIIPDDSVSFPSASAAYTTAATAYVTQADVPKAIEEIEQHDTSSAASEENPKVTSAATYPAKTTVPPKATSSPTPVVTSAATTTIVAEKYPPYSDDVPYTYPSYSFDFDTEELYIPDIEIDPSDFLS